MSEARGVDGSVVLCRTKADSGCGFLLLWLKNAPLHIELHGAVHSVQCIVLRSAVHIDLCFTELT